MFTNRRGYIYAGAHLIALAQPLIAQSYTGVAILDTSIFMATTYTYTVGYGSDYEVYEIASGSYTATVAGYSATNTIPPQTYSDIVPPLTFTDDFRGESVTQTFSESTELRVLPARTVVQHINPTTITRFLPTMLTSVDLAPLTDTVLASAPFPTVTLTGPDDPNRSTSWELDVSLDTLSFRHTINGPTVTHFAGSSLTTRVLSIQTITYTENGKLLNLQL
ncbi:hypothetical protein K7432_017253 [Basidiobolus ranarum]|uniref:Uncharacterized protein n=1 Tax=Basidiobolus ranarum TaxID=34480 RepID=A0ABR2VKL7_9FUNG